MADVLTELKEDEIFQDKWCIAWLSIMNDQKKNVMKIKLLLEMLESILIQKIDLQIYHLLLMRLTKNTKSIIYQIHQIYLKII